MLSLHLSTLYIITLEIFLWCIEVSSTHINLHDSCDPLFFMVFNLHSKYALGISRVLDLYFQMKDWTFITKLWPMWMLEGISHKLSLFFWQNTIYWQLSTYHKISFIPHPHHHHQCYSVGKKSTVLPMYWRVNPYLLSNILQNSIL